MDDLIRKNNEAAAAYCADRRGFIKHGLLFSAALGFWSPRWRWPTTAKALRPRKPAACT